MDSEADLRFDMWLTIVVLTFCGGLGVIAIWVGC